MEHLVHRSSRTGPPVLERGNQAMEKVPPEVVEELKTTFPYMDFAGGREELPEEYMNIFLDDLRGLLNQLQDFEVLQLINEYTQCTNVEMAFGTLDELFDHMKTTDRLREMFLLQSLLLRIGKEGLSEQVAALAKETWGRQDLKIPYSSDARQGLWTAQTNRTIPPSAGRFLIHIRCSANNLATELVKKKEQLASLFQVEPSLICMLAVFPKASFWLLVLAPSPVVQVFKEDWERDDIKEYLQSIHIDEVKFPEEKEEGARGDPGVGAASSATQSTGMEVEPPTKRMKMEKSDETYHPKTAKSAETHPPWKEEELHFELSKDKMLEYIEGKVSKDAMETLKERKFSVSDISFPFLAGMGLTEEDSTTVMDTLEERGMFHATCNLKIVNDCIHGPMEFDPLCMKVIDTAEFQRLRNIKQLGSVYMVYPGASHNRFEHALGMGYLAWELVKSLQQRQPSLGINDVDVLCVTIAALCHNLGYGPHSDLFEQFMDTVDRKRKWKMGDTSLMMFKKLIERNGLKEEMRKRGLTDNDICFIEEQIVGSQGDRQFFGRGESKKYLYEIVANRQNGIDVDKWDAIARDSLMLGMTCSFDHRRFIKHARVIRTSEGYRICARDKDADDLYKMFQARYSLGRRAYFHKVHQAIEAMLLDVLTLVDSSETIRFLGTEGPLRLSECVDDPVAFGKLDDSVFSVVELFTKQDPNLAEARRILDNIHSRHLYKMVAETEPRGSNVGVSLRPNDLKDMPLVAKKKAVIKKVYLDYGLGTQDPINNMLFFHKANINKAVKIDISTVSAIVPSKFCESILRLYCKEHDKSTQQEAVTEFDKWCYAEALKLKR